MMHMELGTLVPHLLYLKNDVLFKFQFGNIAAPQAQKNWSTYPNGPLTLFSPTNIWNLKYKLVDEDKIKIIMICVHAQM